MESKLSAKANKFRPSAIQELSLLAQRCNAINLAEGFPDFPAPSHIKNAAIDAIHSEFNQYRLCLQIDAIVGAASVADTHTVLATRLRHVQGLCDHLAKILKKRQGLDYNPSSDIAICCGQSEAFAASIFAVIDQGDEVILFDPCFESYEGCINLAGGVPVYVALDPPHWNLDGEKLTRSLTSRTKAIVLNSPHNPTGKVFTQDELEVIAEACRSRNCIAITDEVYEHITFENAVHKSLATFEGMQDRTIITSSLSKTFSVTGWRIGWAIAPACIASTIKKIHVKLTDCAPAPFQEAALTALQSNPEYFESLRRDYQKKRDYMIKLLVKLGLNIHFEPRGSFFLFAKLPEDCPLSDGEYVRTLIEKAGVVAVPGRSFFHTSCNYQERYIRFAFCKSDATLAAAAQKLTLPMADGR